MQALRLDKIKREDTSTYWCRKCVA